MDEVQITNRSTIEQFIKSSHLIRLLLCFLSSFLYIIAFAFDSLYLSYLIYISLVPLFIAITHTKKAESIFLVTLFGIIISIAIGSWLGAYHPKANIILALYATFWFGLAGILIKIAIDSKSKLSYLAVAFLWSAIEILKSDGFIAFPYITSPYALYKSSFALKIASIGGSVSLSLFISLINISLLFFIKLLFERQNYSKKEFLKKAILRILPIAFCYILSFALASPKSTNSTTIASTNPNKKAPQHFRVALIQPGNGPQKALSDYKRAFQNLSELSNTASAMEPDLVVWHETAIVPPIDWHYHFRVDRPTYELIAEIKNYLKSYPSPILTGNGYAYTNDIERRIEHNSAILFDKGEEIAHYDKCKLIPFSEYFPFEKQMPKLNKWLVNQFGKMWTPGKESTIFSIGNFNFASPICFEDSFPKHFASFNNPDFFVVLTNDSWSKSSFMQNQHLAMSVFRAAETASVVLRASDSGSTSVIEPNGYINNSLSYFSKNVLYVDVQKVEQKNTFFEIFGKNCDIVISIFSLFFLIYCIFYNIKKKYNLTNIDKTR